MALKMSLRYDRYQHISHGIEHLSRPDRRAMMLGKPAWIVEGELCIAVFVLPD
jgi:hypothetical protein